MMGIDEMEKLDLMSQSLKNLFKEIDEKVTNKITFIDSKKGLFDEKITFESEKIIYSLTNIGIPLNYSIHILDMVIEKIMELPENSTINTSDIRRLVSTGLYIMHTMKDVNANVQKCRIWGDLYLRKYGNPGGPIQIIHRDGLFEPLSHVMLEESIIPKVFSDITKRNKEDVLKKFSKKERNEMRDEVMRIIQELGIYKIHYQTLCFIVKDLATQPPHPWVFDTEDPESFIKYNVEKANKNLEDTKQYYKILDYPNCRNSTIETVHHISASILGYYREFPGCGTLASFYNLKNLLNKIRLFYRYRADKKYDENPDLIWRATEIKDEIDLFGRSKIWEINRDLINISSSLESLLEKLENIDHDLKIIHRDEIISGTIVKLDDFMKICESLLSRKCFLKDELDSAINCSSKDKGTKFENIIFKILSLHEDFIVKKNTKIKEKQYDLIITHRSKKGSFSKLGKYIFVECKNKSVPADVEIVEKLGHRVSQRPPNFCNTGIVISAHGFTRGARNEAIRLFDQEIFLILLDLNDINRLINNDIIDELNAKIEDLFLAVVDKRSD